MKNYRVSGTQRVDGREPGDVFDASYSEAHELYLLQGGHLELVQPDAPVEGADDASDAAGKRNQRHSRKPAESKEQN